MRPIPRYVKAVTPQFQQCRTRLITRHSMRSASAIFMSHTEAITCQLQIISCEESMGDQRDTKVAP